MGPRGTTVILHGSGGYCCRFEDIEGSDYNSVAEERLGLDGHERTQKPFNTNISVMRTMIDPRPESIQNVENLGAMDRKSMKEVDTIATTRPSLDERDRFQESHKDDIALSLERTRAEVAAQLRFDEEEEEKREEKVRHSAMKLLLSREKVAMIQQNKTNTAALKEKGNAAYREKMLKFEAGERAKAHHQKEMTALERRRKIEAAKRERSERLEHAVLSKQKIAELQLRLKREEVAATNSRRADERSSKAATINRLANEKERCDILHRKKLLLEKEERYENSKNALNERNLLLSIRRKEGLMQSLLMADERRDRIEEIKRREQELVRIKQTKEAVMAASRLLAKSQRPIKLNKIYAEQLKLGASEGMAAGTFESPGPGSYFLDISTAISSRGGYMASSRPNPHVNMNPGPGHYVIHPNDDDKATGTVPFAGRGKTDVDWTILTASKLPGVGQYKLEKSSRSQRAAKILGKGTTELDRVVASATKMPGPGDYSLIANTKPRPNSMEAYILGLDNGYVLS